MSRLACYAGFVAMPALALALLWFGDVALVGVVSGRLARTLLAPILHGALR